MFRRVRPAARAGATAKGSAPRDERAAGRRVRAAAGWAAVLLAAGAAVTAAAGCHAANEGVVDYRYFPPPDAGALRLAQTLGGLTPTPDAPRVAGPLAAGVSQLQRAERKYSASLTPADSASVVRPGEGFTITLQQAFVSDFGEGGLTAADPTGRAGRNRRRRGRPGTDRPGGVRPGVGSGDGAGNGVRAVRRRGPAHGRAGGLLQRGRGGPVAVDRGAGRAVPELFRRPAARRGGLRRRARWRSACPILELDGEERDRRRDLLGTLAAFGDRAYPPGSPVLAVLDELGAALLASVPDESVEFRYTCVLHPDRPGDPLPQAVLREGNYVFVKQDHRRLPPPLRAARDAAAALVPSPPPHPGPTAPVDWDVVRFDPLQGRLMAPDPGGARLRFYRRHTYLTLQVRRTGASAGAVCPPISHVSAAPTFPLSGLGSPPVAVDANRRVDSADMDPPHTAGPGTASAGRGRPRRMV